MSSDASNFRLLPRDTNQAYGIGEYAIDMVSGATVGPADSVLLRTEQVCRDSVACGVSAIACGTNAPSVLRREALRYSVPQGGVPMFGSNRLVSPEKAVAACASAVREWDANGTNFGFNPARGETAGEFGHNDFYPVVLAAAHQTSFDGRRALVAMATLDEIRGRLAEVFSLKDHKIDHVVHGAIAAAAVYGALLGATAKQIESAIGLVVAHYIPFRAIRAGEQLSDSKGASAALSAEMALLSVHRAIDGFVGPADIFRNRQAIFCLFEPPDNPDAGPFDLALATGGEDFAVMGMHFKLGLYEHQSAGGIQGVCDLLAAEPGLLEHLSELRRVTITIYEPAFGIIGDPAKRDPTSRQSADHSMVYIVATLLRKAIEARKRGWDGQNGWEQLMLTPADYAEDATAIFHASTRALMSKIDIRHGGPDFDAKYPDGIPTAIEFKHDGVGTFSSGLVMYPEGHARNTSGNLARLLAAKFNMLASLGVDDVASLGHRFTDLVHRSPEEIAAIYDFKIRGATAQ